MTVAVYFFSFSVNVIFPLAFVTPSSARILANSSTFAAVFLMSAKTFATSAAVVQLSNRLYSEQVTIPTDSI